MRIALIGYGRMGKLIDRLASQKGHKIIYRIRSENADDTAHLDGVDVAIEFTHPEAAIENFQKLTAQNIPIVTGTTGWMDSFTEVEKVILKSQGHFFHASNFSVGVHISLAVSNYLAKIIENFPEYKSRIDEWHHTGKKDAPSGTALSFAEGIIKKNKNFDSYAFESTYSQHNELPIYAFREGEIPGTHQIKHESEIDSIILRHEAKNRNGFALGAIKAAEFLIDQKPGLYTMNDLIKLPL